MSGADTGDGTPRRAFPTWLAVAVVVLFIIPATALALRLLGTEEGVTYWMWFAPFDLALLYIVLTGRLGRRRPERKRHSPPCGRRSEYASSGDEPRPPK